MHTPKVLPTSGRLKDHLQHVLMNIYKNFTEVHVATMTRRFCLPLPSCHAYPWGSLGLRQQRLRCNLESQSKSVTVCGCLSAPSASLPLPLSLSVPLCLSSVKCSYCCCCCFGGEHCKSQRRKTIESESVICNCLRHTERPTSLLRMHSPNPETEAMPGTGSSSATARLMTEE